MTICSIVLRCKYYFIMYLDQYLRKSWFLVSKIFVQKITPAPQKTKVMASICKIFKSNIFYRMHRMSGFHKNTQLRALFMHVSQCRLSKSRQTDYGLGRSPSYAMIVVRSSLIVPTLYLKPSGNTSNRVSMILMLQIYQ